MELCYRNNPQSLFRKYSQLITWFANQGIGRDYLSHHLMKVPQKVALMLPNGFIEKENGVYRATFSTKPIYAPKLYPALAKIDTIAGILADLKDFRWLQDIEEFQRLLVWELRLTRNIPALAKTIMFASPETYNPNAHPESTSVDGYAGRASSNETFAQKRAGAGNEANDTDVDGTMAYLAAESTPSGSYYRIWHGFFLYDTSALPDDVNISGATEEHCITYRYNDFAETAYVSLVNVVLASNTAVAASDYQANVDNNTLQAPALQVSTLNLNAYNAFTLNAAGIASISKTGITKFGIKDEFMRADTEPTWGASKYAATNNKFADNTTNIPKLVVTYTTGSASASPSATPSVSVSASPSVSLSISPSVSPSVSPSLSLSLLPSATPSVSFSASPSISISLSPSLGYQVYTRGDYAVLPGDDDDLETTYSVQDETNVATSDNVRVGQTGTLQYMVHQFKDFVGGETYCTIEWEGQSSLAPTLSTIYLQIYNYSLDFWGLPIGWETIDSDNTSSIDTDFILTANVPDLTNYKDTSNVISCRIYQLAL